MFIFHGKNWTDNDRYEYIKILNFIQQKTAQTKFRGKQTGKIPARFKTPNVQNIQADWEEKP